MEPCFSGCHSRYSRRAFTATVLTAAVLCLGDLAEPSSSVDELARRLGADQIRADFIILLDLSGSMRFEARTGSLRVAPGGSQRIDVVRRALPVLLRSVPPGDYVTLVGFHAALQEDPALLVPTWDPGRDLPHFLQRLQGVQPDPRGDTDLGLALEVLRDKVTRTGGNPIQFLYLITDGEHDVRRTPTSRYGTTAGERPWRELAEGWQAILSSPGRVVRTFQVGLFDVHTRGVVERVWPQATFLAVESAEQLSAFFAEQKERLFKEKLRAVVELERRRSNLRMTVPSVPFRLDQAAGIGAAEAEINSGSRLALRVATDLRPRGAASVDVTCVGSAIATLGPSGRERLRVPVGVALRGEPWLRSRRVTVVPIRWSITSTVAEPALAELGIGALPGPPAEGDAMLTAEIDAGRLPLWAVVIAGGWVIAVIVLSPLWLRPRLSGMVATASRAGASETRPFAGERVTLGSAGDATLGIPGGPGVALAIRPGRRGLRWRAVIDAAAGVTLRGRTVVRGDALAVGSEYRIGEATLKFTGIHLRPSPARRTSLALVAVIPPLLGLAIAYVGPQFVPPRLAGVLVSRDGTRARLEGVRATLGSAPDAQVRLPDAPVAATLTARRHGWQTRVEIAPASAETPVEVDRCRVLSGQSLRDGAEIRIDGASFRYQSHS